MKRQKTCSRLEAQNATGIKMMTAGKVVGRISILHRSGPMRTDVTLGMIFPSAASFKRATNGFPTNGGRGR
jgi:hypothetical protein